MSKGPKSSDEIYRNMSAIRSRDNLTEVALRRVLHSRGLRFRLHVASLTGKPDIVFPKERVAVFVDGDYWHARSLREQGPKALASLAGNENREYWSTKFARRVVRDDEVSARLRYHGWMVLRFWEGDIKKNVAAAADSIENTVRMLRRK